MKKYLVLLLVPLLLGGCRATQNGRGKASKPESSVQQKVLTRYYYQLGKKERSQVKFNFKAISDDSADKSAAKADVTSPALVDMTVNNGTNKAVKFDLKKFFIEMQDQAGNDQIWSAKKGIIVVQPGRQKLLAGVFKKIAMDWFNGPGTYCYMNSSYKLAYIYRTFDKHGASSSNLKDPKLIKLNTISADGAATEQTQASSEDSSSASASSASSTSIGENDSANIQVTVGSQFSSFTFKNVSDQPITLDPEMLLLRANTSQGNMDFLDVPSDILNAGPVTINPGQTHSYPNLFGSAAQGPTDLSIAYGSGGDMLWDWSAQ